MKKVIDAAASLRERKKARTREAIIDAALNLFERNGYDNTTIEDIAAAAEVSPRTFFRYFESKLDLIMTRTDSHADDFGPLLADRPAGESLLDALREVLLSQLDAQLDDPLVLREFQVMLSTPSLRTMAREHFYEEEAGLVSGVAAHLGLDEDDLASHVIGAMIAGALWATVNRWVAEGAERDRIMPMLDEAFSILAKGLAQPAVPSSG
ncbi:MAG TPA: TetR family transcriptional regulator [Acidimicrobiales bacterium]|nr:TetR family transcriptional regulator [Acidimicrobiales bacterium]